MKETTPSTITELYVVLGRDNNGNEGIASAVNPVTKIMEPLIGGEGRLKTIATLAKAGSRESGMKFQVAKFSSREPVFDIEPDVDIDE